MHKYVINVHMAERLVVHSAFKFLSVWWLKDIVCIFSKLYVAHCF